MITELTPNKISMDDLKKLLSDANLLATANTMRAFMRSNVIPISCSSSLFIHTQMHAQCQKTESAEEKLVTSSDPTPTA